MGFTHSVNRRFLFQHTKKGCIEQGVLQNCLITELFDLILVFHILADFLLFVYLSFQFHVIEYQQ